MRFGWILGGAIVLAALVIAIGLYRIRAMDNTLVVTGSAKERVSADTAKWVGSFARTVPEAGLREGYAAMSRDESAVMRFLSEKGFSGEAAKASQVFLDDMGRYNPQLPREYTLRQTVELNAADVQKITDIAKNLDTLIEEGVVISTQSLEYYYSKLPETRIALLSDAVEDARNRAEEIAGEGNVGSLKSASVGVVQVLPINSTDVSDYGTYDTSSIDKEVMVTVKTTFRLQ